MVPALHRPAGFLGIVALAVGVRLLLSACEVPSVSLVPEITDDYDDRTTLFRYRFLSGWLGGLLMMVLAFTVFLPTPARSCSPKAMPVRPVRRGADRLVSVIGSGRGSTRSWRSCPNRPAALFAPKAFAEIFDAFSREGLRDLRAGGLAAYVCRA